MGLTNSVKVVIPWWKETTDPHRERSLEFCVSMWNSYGFDVCLAVDESSIFNRSKACNQGVKDSEAELIILADGDVYIPQASIEKGVQVVSFDETWVIPYDVYFNLTQEDTGHFLNGTKKIEECSWDHRILSWAGLSIFKRETYLDLGGHDERFEGWGEEDVAFRLKMDNEYSHHKRVAGNIYHLWHPAPSERTFGSEEYKRNRALLEQEYKPKYKWTDERLKWS